MFSGATAIGTYLINIVKSLGGNTSLYGVAMFAMAFSELPVMMTVPKLMKKFNSVTLILVASIFYICRNYTIGLAPNLIVLIIGMMFQGLSYGLFTGVITYYVTYNLDTQDQMSGQTMIGNRVNFRKCFRWYFTRYYRFKCVIHFCLFNDSSWGRYYLYL